jgi:hypothetical protein
VTSTADTTSLKARVRISSNSEAMWASWRGKQEAHGTCVGLGLDHETAHSSHHPQFCQRSADSCLEGLRGLESNTPVTKSKLWMVCAGGRILGCTLRALESD